MKRFATVYFCCWTFIYVRRGSSALPRCSCTPTVFFPDLLLRARMGSRKPLTEERGHKGSQHPPKGGGGNKVPQEAKVQFVMFIRVLPCSLLFSTCVGHGFYNYGPNFDVTVMGHTTNRKWDPPRGWNCYLILYLPPTSRHTCSS